MNNKLIIGAVLALVFLVVVIYRLSFPSSPSSESQAGRGKVLEFVYPVIDSSSFEKLSVLPDRGYVIVLSTAWSGLIDGGSAFPGSWCQFLSNKKAFVMFEDDKTPRELLPYDDKYWGVRPAHFWLKAADSAEAVKGLSRALVRVSMERKWPKYRYF